MIDNQEKRFIEQAQEGDAVAFEALVKKYDRQILRLIFQMVNHIQDAEDVYQEVFVRVYRKLNRFQFRSEFSTWLYRVAVNTCINFRKKKMRQKNIESGEPDGEFGDGWEKSLPEKSHNPEEQILNKELSRQINTAIDQLSDKQRTVFILRHYHGQKLKEIAGIMECKEGTVKNYLFRATQKMRQQLEPYKTLN